MMNTRKFLRKLPLFLLTLPVLFFIYFPILWLLSASLSNQVDLYAIPMHWIPQHPTLQNYLDIIFPNLAASSVPRTFAVALLNSIKIASAVTIISLVIGSMAAYALARVPFRFSRAILLGIIATRMIPEVSLILPLFIIASNLQLINKPIILIITYMSFALPFAIWMMVAFFQTVPIELEDAARIDGCSRLGHFVPGSHSNFSAWIGLNGDVRFSARLGRILLCPDLHQHAGIQDGASGHVGICGPLCD